MAAFVEFVRSMQSVPAHKSFILQVVKSLGGKTFKVRRLWLDKMRGNADATMTIEGTTFYAREGVLTFENGHPEKWDKKLKN